MRSLFDFRTLDKDFILKNIGQERIFEKYLGIKIELGSNFCSPIREDRNPTCRFKYSKSNKLIFQDFSGHFNGDCFDLVMFMYNTDFKGCMDIILNDFGVLDSGFKPKKKLKRHTNNKVHEKSVIEVKWRDFDKIDLEYWSNHGITTEQLSKYNVGSISYCWLNGEIHYRFNKNDRAYAYWFNNEEIKVYFPHRESNRFLMNTNCIQGWNQLAESGDLLIITKSLKDVMLLDRYGYNSIAPQSESQLLDEKTLLDLKSRFKDIMILYDADRAGARTVIKARKKYDWIKYSFITRGVFGKDYGAKDPTDLYKLNKEDEKTMRQLDGIIRNRK